MYSGSSGCSRSNNSMSRFSMVVTSSNLVLCIVLSSVNGSVSNRL